MPPDNSDTLPGSPNKVVCWPRKFENTRVRLYYLHFAWCFAAILFAVMIFPVPYDVVEPVRWLRWLPDLVAGIAPGLLEYLVSAAVRYPLAVGALFLAFALIRRASSLVKAAEGEHAFQAWQCNLMTTDPPPPSLFVKTIQFLSPLTWVLIAGLALFVLVALLDLFCQPVQAAASPGAASTLGETAVGCASSRNLCRLAPGERMQVTIRSDQTRNETGVWLDEEASYTARFIECHAWQDAGRNVPPEGFQFENNCFGWPCFWWAEWMRPFHEGDWFQVVGRIDRSRDVFAVLDAGKERKVNKLEHTASGELVLLVNDVIYWNNRGVMTIEIRRCPADERKQGSQAPGCVMHGHGIADTCVR